MDAATIRDLVQNFSGPAGSVLLILSPARAHSLKKKRTRAAHAARTASDDRGDIDRAIAAGFDKEIAKYRIADGAFLAIGAALLAVSYLTPLVARYFFDVK